MAPTSALPARNAATRAAEFAHPRAATAPNSSVSALGPSAARISAPTATSAATPAAEFALRLAERAPSRSALLRSKKMGLSYMVGTGWRLEKLRMTGRGPGAVRKNGDGLKLLCLLVDLFHTTSVLTVHFFFSYWRIPKKWGLSCFFEIPSLQSTFSNINAFSVFHQTQK